VSCEFFITAKGSSTLSAQFFHNSLAHTHTICDICVICEKKFREKKVSAKPASAKPACRQAGLRRAGLREKKLREIFCEKKSVPAGRSAIIEYIYSAY